jgi:drug/metabolite transporter (DMT)-like permease
MGIAMLTWGIAWTSAKISNEYLEYNNLVFLRFFIGFLTMLPFLYKRKLILSNITLPIILNIIVTSVLFFIYNQCFFMGTDIGKSGMGGVFVTTTNPVITFIIASIISREFSMMKVFSIGVGVFGGLLILDVFNQGSSAFLFAENQYFIFCSISWGIMTIIMAHGQKKIDSIWYIALCFLVTSFISIFFINPADILEYTKYDMRFIINFFFVCSAMSFGTSIYIVAAYRLGPIQASTFIFSVPFIAMGTAFIFIDEPFSFNVIIGGVLSIISIYLLNFVASPIKPQT